MKKSILFFVFLLMNIVSCIHNGDDKVYKLPIVLNSVSNKVNLLILDLNQPESTIPVATITFKGEYADKISTSEGRKDGFTAVDGVFSFGIQSRFVSIDLDNPTVIEYTVEATGYETRTQEITLDGTNQSGIYIVPMVKNGEEIPGVVAEEENKTLEAGALSEEVEVVTKTEKNETILTIEENTNFVDDSGEKVTGTEILINTQAFQREFDYSGKVFENPNSTVFNFLPQGNISELGVLTNDESGISRVARAPSVVGRKSEDGYLIPLAPIFHFNFKTNSGEKIDELTEEVVLKTYLTVTNEINPETGVLLKEGDLVDVYVKKGNKYQKVASPSIQFDGKYYIEFLTNKTGYYEFGFTVTGDSTCSSFENIILRNNGKPTTYVLMATTQNGTIVGGVSQNLSGDTKLNGKSLNRFKALRSLYNSGLKLVVLGYNNLTQQFETVYNQDISFCDIENQVVDISTSECSKYYDLDLRITCPNIEIVLDDVPVYYKNEGSTNYELFQYVKEGFVKGYAPCLEDATKYVFKMVYDGENRISPSVSGAKLEELSLGFDEEEICTTIEERFGAR
ncbi:hypothetical protein [Wenyingzhuangia sp. IMCC45574]